MLDARFRVARGQSIAACVVGLLAVASGSNRGTVSGDETTNPELNGIISCARNRRRAAYSAVCRSISAAATPQCIAVIILLPQPPRLRGRTGRQRMQLCRLPA
jgi:hypothetical protein